MSLPIGEILFLVLLTLLEAFFVAAEIALVSIRRSRVEQLVDEGEPGARRVRRLLEDPGRFLAVGQLGLTFIGRGFNVRVAAPFNRTIEEGLQKVAAACVEHCPTGALVLRPPR